MCSAVECLKCVWLEFASAHHRISNLLFLESNGIATNACVAARRRRHQPIFFSFYFELLNANRRAYEAREKHFHSIQLLPTTSWRCCSRWHCCCRSAWVISFFNFHFSFSCLSWFEKCFIRCHLPPRSTRPRVLIKRMRKTHFEWSQGWHFANCKRWKMPSIVSVARVPQTALIINWIRKSMKLCFRLFQRCGVLRVRGPKRQSVSFIRFDYIFKIENCDIASRHAHASPLKCEWVSSPVGDGATVVVRFRIIICFRHSQCECGVRDSINFYLLFLSTRRRQHAMLRPYARCLPFRTRRTMTSKNGIGCKLLFPIFVASVCVCLCLLPLFHCCRDTKTLRNEISFVTMRSNDIFLFVLFYQSEGLCSEKVRWSHLNAKFLAKQKFIVVLMVVCIASCHR